MLLHTALAQHTLQHPQHNSVPAGGSASDCGVASQPAAASHKREEADGRVPRSGGEDALCIAVCMGGGDPIIAALLVPFLTTCTSLFSDRVLAQEGC